MFLLIMFLLAAVLCGAAGWGLEKAEGGVQAGRFLRRALWPLGAICLMLPFLARSFSPGDLLQAAAALPLGAGLLAAVQACFVLRRSRTGKKAGVLAAAALVLGCLFLELVPFQVNYWASRGYQPVPLLSAQNAVQWNDAHPELTVSGLQVKAKNLLICYSESGGGAVSAQVSCRDSAFPNRMLPMDGLWQMSEQNEASRCYNLHLDGELLELSLKISAGQQAQVSSITANVPRPFAFSPVRLLCLVLLAGLGFVLRPGSALWQTEYLHRTPAQKWLCRAVCGGIAVLFFCLAYATPMCGHLRVRGLNQQGGSLIGWEGDSGSDASLQYELLAESLAHGHVALEVQPDPKLVALDNPYDLDARTASGANYIWDCAYYNGHYYVYFGVVPVLLFYLPVYLLTGHHMDTATACLAVGLAFLLGMALLLRAVIRRWFPRASAAMYLIGLIAGVFLGGMPGLVGRPDIYELAIACAAMFTVWGFAAWIAASRPCAHRRWLLAFGGLCLALVAGCRPQVVLFSVLILPLFGREYLLEKRLLTKRGVLDFACAMAPFAAVAAGLMAYNAARFGSPFEFGANFNLTSLDMTGRALQPGRILQAVWNYLFSAPGYTPVFPFLQAQLQTAFHGFTAGDALYGGLYTARPLLLMVLGALVCQKELKQKKLGGVLACWLGAALVILSIDVLMTDMNLRYAADFATPLVLASLAVILQGEEVLRTGRKARLFRLGTAGLLAVSTLHSLLVLMQSQSPWLQSNPMLYFTLQQTVMFWR